jgi:hypothetical protein
MHKKHIKLLKNLKITIKVKEKLILLSKLKHIPEEEEREFLKTLD